MARHRGRPVLVAPPPRSMHFAPTVPGIPDIAAELSDSDHYDAEVIFESHDDGSLHVDPDHDVLVIDEKTPDVFDSGGGFGNTLKLALSMVDPPGLGGRAGNGAEGVARRPGHGQALGAVLAPIAKPSKSPGHGVGSNAHGAQLMAGARRSATDTVREALAVAVLLEFPLACWHRAAKRAPGRVGGRCSRCHAT